MRALRPQSFNGAVESAQLRQLRVQVGQGGFQHVAVPGIAAGFQLLQDLGTGERQGGFLAPGFELFRAQMGFGLCRFLTGRFHLSFYCLAFPTSGHVFNYTGGLRKEQVPRVIRDAGSW